MCGSLKHESPFARGNSYGIPTKEGYTKYSDVAKAPSRFPKPVADTGPSMAERVARIQEDLKIQRTYK